MPIYSLLLGALLVGQAGSGPNSALIAPSSAHPPAQALPTGTADRSAGIRRNSESPPKSGAANGQTHASPDQLVAEALAQPLGGPIAGQPLMLRAAIETTSDRSRQLEAIHAYWRLVRAAGDYHYLWDRQQRLSRLTAAANEAGDLRTAQAVATARLQEAEVHLTAAQHELAAAARLAETAPLPWPADRPLTEGYRTRLAQLYAGRRPPDRLRMLDQTLPLRQRAVEGHAAAVLAAEESLDAYLELYAAGQGSLAAVLRAIDAEVQQQQGFLAAVCRYNDEIADYSLAVVPAQTSADVLVMTLIIPVRTTQPFAVAPRETTGVRDGEIGPSVSGGAVPAGYQEPPLAPPREALPPARIGALPPASAAPPAVAPSPPQNDATAPRLAPPQELAIPLLPEEPASRDKSTDTSIRRSTFKQVVETAAAISAGRRGTGDPGEQAVKPAGPLYENDPQSAKERSPIFSVTPRAEDGASKSAKTETVLGTPLQLADCLRAAAVDRRLEAIDAYWAARQAEVYGSLLAVQIGRLDSLRPALAAQSPLSPTAMLVLRSAKLAVEARVAEAEADRIAASFQLALAAGLPVEKDLRPTSVPVAGRFSMASSEKERTMPPTWPLRQAEAALPRWVLAISSQCAAVTEAETAWTAAAGRTDVERTIAALQAYTDETTALLQELSDYNRAIARYVLLRLAPSAAADAVVAALENR